MQKLGYRERQSVLATEREGLRRESWLFNFNFLTFSFALNITCFQVKTHLSLADFTTYRAGVKREVNLKKLILPQAQAEIMETTFRSRFRLRF